MHSVGFGPPVLFCKLGCGFDDIGFTYHACFMILLRGDVYKPLREQSTAQASFSLPVKIVIEFGLWQAYRMVYRDGVGHAGFGRCAVEGFLRWVELERGRNDILFGVEGEQRARSIE